MLTLTLVVTREPMDLNGILDTERKYRVNNRLCLAYGLPGHWKDAYNSAKIANPVLILPY